jgi:hypothetical protein
MDSAFTAKKKASTVSQMVVGSRRAKSLADGEAAGGFYPSGVGVLG